MGKKEHCFIIAMAKTRADLLWAAASQQQSVDVLPDLCKGPQESACQQLPSCCFTYGLFNDEVKHMTIFPKCFGSFGNLGLRCQGPLGSCCEIHQHCCWRDEDSRFCTRTAVVAFTRQSWLQLWKVQVRSQCNALTIGASKTTNIMVPCRNEAI